MLNRFCAYNTTKSLPGSAQVILMRFFSISSAFIIIYWNHVKSEMVDSYFTLSSSVVVKIDNKVKPIVSNRLYRLKKQKQTWNDVFDEVTDLEEVDLKKTDQILVSLGQSWTNWNIFLRMALPVNSVLGIFGLTSSSSVSFSNFRFFGTLGNVESAPILYVFISLET